MLRISTREYAESFKRFLKHLPPDKDTEVLILKGHLLVERQLEKYLVQRLPNPSALNGENLKFGRKLAFVRALSKDPDDEWLWDALHVLNKLRNELAHQLESQKLEHLLQDFIGKVEASPELPDLTPPNEVTERFHRSLFAAHEAMSLRVNL